MIRGIFSSKNGLAALQKKINSISNNLANVSTTGYKREKTAFAGYMDTKITLSGEEEISSYSYGAKAEETVRDFSQGTVRETGRVYDYAIMGGGFFLLDSDGKEYYSRNGCFVPDSSGYLTASGGEYVMGFKGRIKVLPDGSLSELPEVKDFTDYSFLKNEDNGRYSLLEGGKEISFSGQLEKGCLEASNTDITEAMTELMSAERIFSLNSRVLVSQDEILEKTVNEVGKVR